MTPDTLEWLEQSYPDATSRSMAVLMAISDARRLDQLCGRKDVYLLQEIDDLDTD